MSSLKSHSTSLVKVTFEAIDAPPKPVQARTSIENETDVKALNFGKSESIAYSKTQSPLVAPEAAPDTALTTAQNTAPAAAPETASADMSKLKGALAGTEESLSAENVSP